jgi:hypothetical protein
MRAAKSIPMDSRRLAHGDWVNGRCKGQGDIVASYSADRIGEGRPVRTPFAWRGGLWICVGMCGGDETAQAEAYRIVLRPSFEGETFTYQSKISPDSGDTARADPLGFYHGVEIKHAGSKWVLVGPQIKFTPSSEKMGQLDLFGDAA